MSAATLPSTPRPPAPAQDAGRVAAVIARAVPAFFALVLLALGSAGLWAHTVVIAAVVLLVRGRYPRDIFALVVGINRWALRLAAYAGLLRDEYPPFRLDR